MRFSEKKQLAGDSGFWQGTQVSGRDEGFWQGTKAFYLLSSNRGFWNHTRQCTFLQQRILKSYQAIHFLIATGFWNHTRQYTFLQQRVLKSFQAIYFLIATGFWNHSRQYTYLWWRILKSYQAIYILMVQDPGSDSADWHVSSINSFLLKRNTEYTSRQLRKSLFLLRAKRFLMLRVPDLGYFRIS